MNETISIFVAIITAYLIGSIPFAYIFTRMITGNDIRDLGSGNAGANNVFQEAGLWAAVPTAFFDVGKGALAVSITYWLLDVPFRETNLFVIIAALAAIAGHTWSVYLRFHGGNGLSTTIGTLAVLLPWELLIVIGILLILRLVTHNLVLSVNVSLLSVPISSWFLEKEWLYVGFSIVLIIMLVLNFVPTAKVALIRAGNRKNLMNEVLRRNKR